jgi:DNA polymerase-1
VVSVAGKPDVLDEEGVKAKTGVYPGQIVDWLALIGDTADNIPGVRGVGPKTAAQLLHEYGDLDGVWAHLGDIPREKLRDALASARDDVHRNVELVRLDPEAPCGVTWREGAVGPADVGKLIAFYERLEFDAFAKELREPDLFDL